MMVSAAWTSPPDRSLPTLSNADGQQLNAGSGVAEREKGDRAGRDDDGREGCLHRRGNASAAVAYLKYVAPSFAEPVVTLPKGPSALVDKSPDGNKA